MFFYLSFLRPPPLQCSISGTITITPQIANDLRTELYEEAIDIWYSWTSSSGFATQPTKLTTWYGQSSAYKEITVPLPPRVNQGSSWALGLTSDPVSKPYIDLASGPSLGSTPFPVTSLPVLFSNKKPNVGKQEKIERFYRIPLPSDRQEKFLKIVEQTSFDLDKVIGQVCYPDLLIPARKKIWDSGVGLSSWLVDLVENVCSDPVNALRKMLLDPEPCKILELGAGTGIVSLTIAAIRASLKANVEDSGIDRIITTDLPSAMPLLQRNISTNLGALSTSSCPEAVVLDWDKEIPETVKQELSFDMVVMADVTYNTSSFPSLVRTLTRLIASSDKSVVVLLGYKERHPDERVLWGMTKAIGLEFVKVGKKDGAGGASVEMWLAHS